MIPPEQIPMDAIWKLIDEMIPFNDFLFNFSLMDIIDLFYMNVTQLEKNMNESRWLESNKVYH